MFVFVCLFPLYSIILIASFLLWSYLHSHVLFLITLVTPLIRFAPICLLLSVSHVTSSHIPKSPSLSVSSPLPSLSRLFPSSPYYSLWPLYLMPSSIHCLTLVFWVVYYVYPSVVPPLCPLSAPFPPSLPYVLISAASWLPQQLSQSLEI